MCLSTCNRTELYLVARRPRRGRERCAAEALVGRARPELYRLRDEAAALHLFRVAAGLDSLVPGEGEILGQVRRSPTRRGAAAPCSTASSARPCTPGRRCGPRRRSPRAPSSVSSAAAALAQQVFGDLEAVASCSSAPARSASWRRGTSLRAGRPIALVASRTLERAASSPSASTREALALERARRTSWPRPTSSSRRRARRASSSRRWPGLGAQGAARSSSSTSPSRATSTRPSPSSTACYLYDIDDLEAVVSESLSGRRREAERAESIVDAGGRAVPRLAGVARRRPGDRVAPRAGRGDPLRRAREGRGASRGACPRASGETVESLTTQIVNKLLHLPIVRLKEAAAADGPGYVDAARHLFGLGEEDGRAGPGRNPRE